MQNKERHYLFEIHFALSIDYLMLYVFIGVIFGRMAVPLSFSVHDIRPDRWVSQHFRCFLPPQVTEYRPEIESFHGRDRRSIYDL